MNKQENKVRWYHHGYRIICLGGLSIAAFAGLMSVLSGDRIIAAVIAAALVFLAAKEIY